MSKISVFGGSGFIGSKFCTMYSNDILKINRNDYASQSNNILYFISTVDNYNVHNDIHVDIDTNLSILMNVLENIPKDSNAIFNFVSSWFVYGKNNEIPFREDFSKCNPAGFYSITKHCAEQLLVSYCQTFNIKYRIFRLSNVLGTEDKKISKKKNALQYLIREIVNDNDIHLYYGGEVLRDYMGVEDICKGIALCMKKSPTNQIINIGSGNPYRFIDLVTMAIRCADSKSKIIHIDSTNFHDIVQVRHSYLDISKLSSYGFVQTEDIESTITRLVNFYKSERVII